MVGTRRSGGRRPRYAAPAAAKASDGERERAPAALRVLQHVAAELRCELNGSVAQERQERMLQLMPSIVPRGWTPCLLPPCIAFKVPAPFRPLLSFHISAVATHECVCTRMLWGWRNVDTGYILSEEMPPYFSYTS